MARVVVEKKRELPIHKDVDVVVVGGGSAGLGAAVAAARNGARTLLIERYGFLGGQATAGMVGTIGGGHQNYRQGQGPTLVIRGVLEEFIDRLTAAEGAAPPFVFEGQTWLVPYDPLAWKNIAEEMVLEAGGEILYHTFVTAVIKEQNAVTGVIVENKSGRSAVRGKVFIDASGDADVAHLAGAPCVKGDNGNVQLPSTMFRMANVDTDQALAFPTEELWRTLREAMERREFDVPRYDGYILPSPRPREVTLNITTVTFQGKPLDATDVRHLTWGEIEGRRQVREYERFLRKYIPGFEKAFVNDVGPQVGVRESRNILGEYVLTFDDVKNLARFDDAVVRYCWPLEQHRLDRVEWTDFPQDYYEIPYRSLLPQEVDQVLVVGRCFSVEHRAQAAARGTSLCIGQGQAAGTAAAMSIKSHITPRQIDVHELQEVLVEQDADITVYARE